MNSEIGILTVAFRSERFIEANMNQFAGYGLPQIIVCARESWHGKLKDRSTMRMALTKGLDNTEVDVLYGDYTSDAAQRNAGLRYMKKLGLEWAIVVDTDEFWTEENINILLSDIKKYSAHVDAVTAPNMHVYWKTWDNRIWPDPQPDKPIVAIKTDKEFSWSRLSEGTLRAETQAEFHHLSYVRTDQEMQDKLKISEHSHEFVKGWYDQVWKNKNRVENLHPVIPSQFVRLLNKPMPEELQELF